jgi:phenylacetaldehyde dehydrogenase
MTGTFTRFLDTVPESAGRLSDDARSYLGSPMGLVIDGNRGLSARDGASIAVHDPATGEVITEVALGGPADVDDAVQSAAQAFDDGRWRRLGPAQQSTILWRIADLLEAEAETLAELETLDVGRPIAQSRAMVAGTIATFRHYAGWPSKIYGTVNPVGEDALAYTAREPIGVVGAITAWNGPLALASVKVAPALAAGNTVVLKPSEEAPLSTLRLADIMLNAGVPAGVVNVIPGTGEAGIAIVEHPSVGKITFTGSTGVGQDIQARTATSLKPVTLELGGKSPNIVFADADVTKAAAAATSIWSNCGQVCFAGSRLLVHRSVAPALVDAIVERSRDLRIGNGLDPASDLGPLVSHRQQQRVGDYLNMGRSAGFPVALGGRLIDGPGYFVEPTIFTDVDNSSRIAQDEIFGPVLSVIEFDDDDEALALANDTRYGLAAAVWTSNLTRAHRMARHIRAGTVWINTFGVLDRTFPTGGYKQSGLGREHGIAWIDEFTETKSVYLSMTS